MHCIPQFQHFIDHLREDHLFDQWVDVGERWYPGIQSWLVPKYANDRCFLCFVGDFVVDTVVGENARALGRDIKSLNLVD